MSPGSSGRASNVAASTVRNGWAMEELPARMPLAFRTASSGIPGCVVLQGPCNRTAALSSQSGPSWKCAQDGRAERGRQAIDVPVQTPFSGNLPLRQTTFLQQHFYLTHHNLPCIKRSGDTSIGPLQYCNCHSQTHSVLCTHALVRNRPAVKKASMADGSSEFTDCQTEPR